MTNKATRAPQRGEGEGIQQTVEGTKGELHPLEEKLLEAGVPHVVCSTNYGDQTWYYVIHTEPMAREPEDSSGTVIDTTVLFKFPKIGISYLEVSIISKIKSASNDVSRSIKGKEEGDMSIRNTYFPPHTSSDKRLLKVVGCENFEDSFGDLSEPLRVVDDETGLVVKIVEAEDGRLTLSLEDNKDQPEE